MRTPTAFASLITSLIAALAATPAVAQTPAPSFDVVVLAQSVNEIHAPMVQGAKTWLTQLAKDSNFTLTWVETPEPFTDTYLSKYELILQLNYVPWSWSATAHRALEKYVEEGRGGWIGVHHALLFGRNVTPSNQALWDWFYKFMGEVNYRAYIASFVEATVRIEQASHPVNRGVPATFRVGKEEWYTWDRTPRPRVKVLANVDEDSYTPNSTVKMGGDHPVAWTNENAPYKARNLFLQVGHHPDHYKNEAYVTLMRNAILWAARTNTPVGLGPVTDRPAHARPALDWGTHFSIGSHVVDVAGRSLGVTRSR